MRYMLSYRYQRRATCKPRGTAWVGSAHNGLDAVCLGGWIDHHRLSQNERDGATQPSNCGKGDLLVGEVLLGQAEERPEDEDQEESDCKDADVHQGEAPEGAYKGAQLILRRQLLR